MLVLGGLWVTCLDVWIVPSDDSLFNASIAPSLEPGDTVILWRRGTPKFGDLVRCSDPEAAGRYVVGRIVGEPGDRIRADSIEMTVNEKPVGSMVACAPPKTRVPDPQSGDPVELPCDLEEIGGDTHPRLRAPRPEARGKVTSAQIAAANVFIASDDRYFHDDSRDFGAIARGSCPARIVYRLWSERGWFDEERRLMYIH